MTAVSAQLKARVVAELTKCIEVLEKKFVGYKFPMPTIKYSQRGTTAGTAQFSTWTINLNAGLLVDPRHTVEMIEETAPHELAHLVTFKVYPETMERGPMQRTRSGRLKRGKREVHGPRWQYVMRVMGKSPERCHDMDTSNVRTRERVRYDWLCTGCNTVIELGPKHNKAQLLYGSVHHKTCRGHKLVKPTAAPAAAPVATPRERFLAGDVPPIQLKTTPIVPKAPEQLSGNKIDVCKTLYLKFSMLSRAEVIAKFVSQAGCTPAGAGTYYATCKKLYG